MPKFWDTENNIDDVRDVVALVLMHAQMSRFIPARDEGPETAKRCYDFADALIAESNRRRGLKP